MSDAGKRGATSAGSGRETELKLRVDDLAGLMKIAAASGGTPEPTILQRNAFYDTPDRALGAQGLIVRVRRETPASARNARGGGGDVPGRTFVTAKGPGTRQGSLTSVREEEVEIGDDDDAAVRAGADPIALLEDERGGPLSSTRRALVGALRKALGGRPVQLLGAFENERTRIPVELSHGNTTFRAVLELDRTRFPGDQVHHEVEMEVPDDVVPADAAAAFADLYARAGVVGRVSPGKARRFFAALRGDRLE